jgi:regulator of replication initiation timing
MATKTLIETPAGETIEILDDRSWCELTSTNELSLRSFNGFKLWTIRALYERGEFRDKSGRAVSGLMQLISTTYPNASIPLTTTNATGIFNQPINYPAFERVINGKRTFSIKLIALPQSWFIKVTKAIADQPAEPTPEPVAADVPDTESAVSITDQDIQALLDSVPGVDAPTIYDEPPPLELSIASQVAMSLLTTCVEIITAGSGAAIDERVRRLQGDVAEVSQRLSQRLAENDSLRRQLRAAGDELRALRVERDGLRGRLRATEANLTAALKGDAVQAINGEIRKRVDQIMRVAPTSDKGE